MGHSELCHLSGGFDGYILNVIAQGGLRSREGARERAPSPRAPSPPAAWAQEYLCLSSPQRASARAPAPHSHCRLPHPAHCRPPVPYCSGQTPPPRHARARLMPLPPGTRSLDALCSLPRPHLSFAGRPQTAPSRPPAFLESRQLSRAPRRTRRARAGAPPWLPRHHPLTPAVVNLPLLTFLNRRPLLFCVGVLASRACRDGVRCFFSWRASRRLAGWQLAACARDNDTTMHFSPPGPRAIRQPARVKIVPGHQTVPGPLKLQ